MKWTSEDELERESTNARREGASYLRAPQVSWPGKAGSGTPLGKSPGKPKESHLASPPFASISVSSADPETLRPEIALSLWFLPCSKHH